MTGGTAQDGARDPRASRRRLAAVAQALPMVPLVLLMGLRVALDPPTGPSTLVPVVVGALVFLVVLLVVFARVRNRQLDRLILGVGPSGWGALCDDPDDRQQWMALLVDGAGLRLVRRRGDVRRSWGWAQISDVTVERLPVALTTSVGVVLHLRDGSAADLLLPNRMHLRYSPTLAAAAASGIRAGLDAFRAAGGSGALPARQGNSEPSKAP